MALQRIKLNSAEVAKLLRGEGIYAGVRADLKRRAEAVQGSAGEGYETTVETGPNRARAEVRTATVEARRREARSQTLLRALDAGRR